MKKTTKHRLTTREVQTLGPGKYADGGGLYLIVEASGARRWLFRYTAGGKRRDQGFGSAAKVSLARAREKAAEATALLARGIDPLVQRQEQRAAEKAREAGARTFGSFADAWFDSSVAPGLRNEKHVAQWKVSLSDTFCSFIRNKPIALITTEDVLAVLKPVWTTRSETASRLRARIERVLDAAKAARLRPDHPNPARWRGHLSLMLPPPAKLTRGHHAALPWEDVPALKLVDRAIADRDGRFHFASLIRCTVERFDPADGSWRGTGGGMLDNFHATPFGHTVIDECTRRFLSDLPKRTRIAILLGMGSKGNYIGACRRAIERARPGRWRTINEVAYADDQLTVVHTEHFASQGALIPNWLSGDAHPRGRFGNLARQAVTAALAQQLGPKDR